MPRIRCRYIDCIYLEEGYCGTSTVELDPDEGCLRYTRIGEVSDDDWEEEEIGEIWDEEDDDLYLDEEEDDWIDEEDL